MKPGQRWYRADGQLVELRRPAKTHGAWLEDSEGNLYFKGIGFYSVKLDNCGGRRRIKRHAEFDLVERECGTP